MKQYTPLQRHELSTIVVLNGRGESSRAIARELSRAPSTVSTALTRLRQLDPSMVPNQSRRDNARVEAYMAQQAARRAVSAKNAQRWPLTHPGFAQLIPRLMQQHSLAQSVEGLRRDTQGFGPVPALPSRSTLYRLASPLGWRNKQRYPSIRLRQYGKRAQTAQHRLKAPNAWVYACPTVAERPEALTERSQSFYMEIDSLGSPKGDSKRLVVATCRHTRYTMIGLIADTKADSVLDWVKQRMQAQGLPIIGLIPDQGVEFSRLSRLKKVTVYPCQPHRPWQKPTVENTNGLIRFYIPKGTLISSLTPGFVAHIEHQLNHRPRQCINWETPHALLSRLHPAARL